MKKEVVAIYTRVSTTEQATEGYSIGEQKERLEKYAEAHNWTVYAVYSDPGFSGGSLDRPGITKVIRDAGSGKFTKILVYKLDRLSRSQKDTLYLIEDIFIANDIDFISMTESLDTGTPFGRAMIGILSVFAQLEREQIRERMQLGADARAKDGYYHGGPYAPIGYDYLGGNLVINEYEALQVKKIWDLAESGLPIYSVYKQIRDAGYKTKYGSWSDSAVRSTLTSIVISGRITWKGETYQGRHEAIIDPDRFDRFQEYLEKRDTGRFSRTPFKRTSLLGGLIWCGNCGARYFVKQNTVKRHKGTPPDAKPNRYYTCYSRGKTAKSMVKDPNCKNKSYNVKTLDKVVLDEIRKLALDPEYLDSVIESRPDPEDNSQVLKDRIVEIDKQIERLVDLYTVGGIDLNKISERIQDLSDEKSALEDQILTESADKPTVLSPEETRRILLDFNEVVDTSDPERLKKIVESLIDAIVINGEEIRIHWRFN